MNFPKLTKKQKIAIAAGVGIIILIIVSVVCVRSCGSGNSNSNVINLAKTYADKGEYDRALSLLDTILLKDADNLEVLALLDEIIQLKKDAETGKETSSNVTVDIDTDGITNAMQDSISSMKDALAESNKQAEENRLSMERLMKLQEDQKRAEEKRRVQEAEEAKLKKQQDEERKAKEAKAAEEKRIAEEKRKAKEAEIAKKNAELKKKIDAVNEQLRLGKTALATGDVATAIEHFKKANSMLPIDKNDPSYDAAIRSDIAQSLYEAYEKSSSKTEKDKLFTEAVAMANKALEGNPNDANAHYILAQDALKKNDLNKALTELTKAIQSNPNSYLYYYELGKIQYRQKKYSEAVRSFTTSCDLNGSFEPSRYNLGVTQLKLGNDNAALSAFRKAIDINPRYEKAYLEEARILTKRKDYNGAINSYESVLVIDNTNVSATMELGNVYYQAGKLSKAEEKFRKAISMLEPCSDLTLTKFNLSTVLFDQNKFSEAEKFAREAYQEKDFVKNDKTKANIIYNYALILDVSKKVDEAIPFYMEVLKLNPKHTKTKINLGVMYMNLTPPDLDTALALFLQVYNDDKNNFEANNNLGNVYLLKEDYLNSILYYQNALKSDSKSLEARSNLSRAYAKNGDYEKAKESYTELLRMNQKDWDAYIELAKVCIQLNQNNLAEGYLLTVKEKNPTFKAAEIDSLLESIK